MDKIATKQALETVAKAIVKKIPILRELERLPLSSNPNEEYTGDNPSNYNLLTFSEVQALGDPNLLSYKYGGDVSCNLYYNTEDGYYTFNLESQDRSIYVRVYEDNFYTTWYSVGGTVSEVWVTGSVQSSAIISGSYGSVATSQYAVAHGYRVRAASNNAHAEGYLATASGESSHAEGSKSLASNMAAHAEGNFTTASGQAAHAEGQYTTAYGFGSHAEGYRAYASNGYSHAEGNYATASGWYSHAEGTSTTASGESSHAEGYQTSATNHCEHAQGKFNATRSYQIFSIGCGDNNSRRKNAVCVVTGSSPSASIYVYGIGGYDGTNPQPGVNDLATTVSSGLSGDLMDMDDIVDVLEVLDADFLLHYYSKIPLTFEVTQAGNILWRCNNASGAKTISYKKNDGDWTSITSTTSGVSISVVAGDKVQFKGTNTVTGGSSYYSYFGGSANCRYRAFGNPYSLLNADDFNSLTTVTNQYALAKLFYNCTYITDAECLVMPVTISSNATYCYYQMFAYATNLVKGPRYLPSTTLSQYCYANMFQGCDKMVSANIEIPATDIPYYACYYMFSTCQALTTAPSMSTVRTIGTHGCDHMFSTCTALTKAPDLDITSVSDYGCYYMFSYSTRLNYIRCTLPTYTSSSYQFTNWVSNVSSSGTFVRNDAATNWPTGINGIPSGWTVQTVSI